MLVCEKKLKVIGALQSTPWVVLHFLGLSCIFTTYPCAVCTHLCLGFFHKLILQKLLRFCIELSELKNCHFSVFAEPHPKFSQQERWIFECKDERDKRGCDLHTKTSTTFSQASSDLGDFQGRSWTVRHY